MRSVSLFLTAAAVGLAGASWTEADVTVTVTATATHTVCPVTTIETCEAPGSSTVNGWSPYSTSSKGAAATSSTSNTNGWPPYFTSSKGAAATSGTSNADGWWGYSTSSGHVAGASTTTTVKPAEISSAENAWASKWDAEKTKYVGPWNDWSASESGAGVPTGKPTGNGGNGGDGGHGGYGSSSTSGTSGTWTTSSTHSGSYTTSAPYGGWNASTTTSTGTATTSTSTTSSVSGCPTYTPEKNASDICNSAADRSTWCDNQDINSNPYTNGYKTGQVRSYTLVIENTTLSYDGTGPKVAFTINGQVPGPVIEANWGDTVEVTVINKLQDNATSIHFHGVRQEGTNDMDGVPGVTECAIAGNGGSKTYTWLASSYGTSWYHSHAFAQYGDGIRGPIVIHGPATANYDIDMGTVMIDDT